MERYGIVMAKYEYEIRFDTPESKERAVDIIWQHGGLVTGMRDGVLYYSATPEQAAEISMSIMFDTDEIPNEDIPGFDPDSIDIGVF